MCIISPLKPLTAATAWLRMLQLQAGRAEGWSGQGTGDTDRRQKGWRCVGDDEVLRA